MCVGKQVVQVIHTAANFYYVHQQNYVKISLHTERCQQERIISLNICKVIQTV